jgi:hypothetical protein
MSIFLGEEGCPGGEKGNKGKTLYEPLCETCKVEQSGPRSGSERKPAEVECKERGYEAAGGCFIDDIVTCNDIYMNTKCIIQMDYTIWAHVCDVHDHIHAASYKTQFCSVYSYKMPRLKAIVARPQNGSKMTQIEGLKTGLSKIPDFEIRAPETPKTRPPGPLSIGVNGPNCT